MAININPGNFSGLGALAGARTGNLGLQVPGSLGLQRDRLRTQQMGQIAGLLNQNRQMDMRQQQMQAQQGLAQQGMNLDARRVDIQEAVAKQQMQMQKLQAESTKLLDEKKEKIDEMGAFATAQRVMLEKAETPTEERAMQEEIIAEAKEKGYIEDKEADQLKKMPISRFKGALDFKIMQLGKINDLHKLNAASKTPSGREVSITKPDGTVVHMPATKPVESQAQKELMDREQGLKEVARIRDKFNEDYFGYREQFNLAASKVAQQARNVPIVGGMVDKFAGAVTGKDPKERGKFIREASDYLNSVEQFFQQRYRKPITGAQAAVEELKQLRQSFLSGDMGPSEFQGSLDNIIRRYTSDAEFNKSVLREGVSLKPREGYSQDQVDATVEKYKAMGHSEEKIQEALRKNKIIE